MLAAVSQQAGALEKQSRALSRVVRAVEGSSTGEAWSAVVVELQFAVE